MPVCYESWLDDRIPVTERSLSGQVKQRLEESSYQLVRRVFVEDCQGVLTLSGRLPNFYLKQVAQTIAAGVDGVANIDNQIEVAQVQIAHPRQRLRRLPPRAAG